MSSSQSDSAARLRIHGNFRTRPFRPAPWLPGPHLQTVGGKLLRPSPSLSLTRRRIDTPDGDFLDLDLAPEPRPDAPLVLVLHGLEGSSRRGYVRLAMEELHSRGVRPIAMNFRSCSGEPNRRPRFYHSGETSDLSVALRWLRQRFPDRPLGALGFSLGGNVLLKFLGESHHESSELLNGAAAISVPFDLVAGTRAIEAGAMGRLYTYYFIRSLRKKATAKADVLDGVLDLELVLRARTLREYDEVATAPLHGFAGAGAYYRKASSNQFLGDVRVPTLLLQSEDDPFLPADAIPRVTIQDNPYLLPALTPAGGHVGFVFGPGPWRPRFWAESEAARYLATILDL